MRLRRRSCCTLAHERCARPDQDDWTPLMHANGLSRAGLCGAGGRGIGRGMRGVRFQKGRCRQLPTHCRNPECPALATTRAQHLDLQQLKARTEFANVLRSGMDDAAVDESKAIDLVLRAGDVSVHHPNVIHGSNANTSSKRRCGLTIRYIPTTTRIVSSEPWPSVFHLRCRTHERASATAERRPALIRTRPRHSLRFLHNTARSKATDKHFEYLKAPLSRIGTAVSFTATPVMTAVT